MATPETNPDAARPDGTEPPAPDWRRLEARLIRLESYLRFQPLSEADVETILAGANAPAAPAGPTAEEKEAGLEMEIGETWMARVGVVALICGLAFLVTYPFATLPSLVPGLIGYAAVGGLLLLARRWRSSLPQIAPILFGGALFLLYFATLRLHFFSAHPFISSPAAGVFLLVAVLAVQFRVADRRRSELTAGLVVVLSFATALISDSPAFTLGLITATAATTVWLFRRRQWHRLLNVTILLAYATHLLWLFGNPLLGHPVQRAAKADGNIAYLAAYALCFALVEFFRTDEDDGLYSRVIRVMANGLGATLLAALNCFFYYQSGTPWIMGALSLGFLATALLAWNHHRSLLATALYACLGYLALSAAIFAYFPSPDFFGWLAWQSLLVAATAVWFQSKIIVVANVFIYGGIYLLYLFLAPAAGLVNLSFALVALAIARILNWQQERLSLQTELLRNFYLGAALVIIPYGLYHTVPPGWVSVSWLVTAGFYFLASALLHNRKYRWMGILMLLATIAYVFIVDLARLELLYRISSTLVLGVVLLVVSMLYARSRRR
ncbi:MAG: DUF2339 domain-containing protein [Opitutales bacterium]